MLLPFANAPGAAGGSGTVTSVSVATANGFSGTVANPTTTPDITIIAGAITPTSVNGLTITSSTGTLTITNLKTLTIDNSLELAGTDSTKMTFPGASDTIAGLGTIQTFTAAQTFNSGKLILAGSGSGSTTLNASAAASGTLTLPAATDTLVGKATTDTLTNKDVTSGTNTFPTFNQNTTGSAATLTTPRAIYGNNFDGSAALTQVIASTYGGTGNGFTKFSGPTTSEKTFTLPDASDTLMGLGTTDSITGAKTFGAGTALIAGASTGKATLAYGSTATNSTLTLPTSSGGDTLVGKATTDTFTNKTYDTAGTGNVLKINGTQVSDITGTGKVVLDTSPTLVTPTIGVATATSINKVAITAPATSATLTIADGKTLTVNSSLTLAGTDSTTMTFPSSSDTVVTLAATQTLTNKTIAAGSNTISGIANSNLSTTAGDLGGAWKAWTPTWTNFTIGNGTNDFKYTQIGKTVYFRGIMTLGTTSSMGTGPTFTLPVTSVTVPSADMQIATVKIYNGSGNYNGLVSWASTTTGLVQQWDVNNNTVQITSTVPGTWTTAWAILVQGFYEVA